MEPISRRTFIKAGTLAGVGICVGCSRQPKFDLIIKGGTVFDGLGNPGIMTDVGLLGDKIIAIEDLTGAKATQIIYAKGLYVSPGFIDIHTHTDMELLVNSRGESKVRQGVTTEVSGNCGYSPFPLTEADATELARINKEKYGIDVKWHDIQGFFDELRKNPLGINYASFTGHGDLRAFVMGRNDRKPTTEELEKMKAVLASSLEKGSLGLSTGLEYAPGSYADTEELVELCRVVKERGGVYSTHVRSEDARVEEAMLEAVDIARRSGVSLQISHFKACNRPNWHKVDNMLKIVHEAKDEGIDVQIDRYPYNAWGTGLDSFLPLWSRQGETDEILARMKDRKTAPQIAEYMNTRATLIGGWDHVMISSCNLEHNKKWQGKTIHEAAEKTGKTPTQFVFDLLIEERNNVGAIGFAMDENNLKKVLADPLCVIGSDGNATAPYGKLHQGNPHPRYYGTFARVLGKYCREEKLFDWQTAIQKMTSLSARKLHFDRRGEIRQDYYADITVFNPETVIDRATFTDPHQYASGIEYVLINGKVVISKGEHTGELPGRIL
ncbi:MAG: D-aminoacylase [Candidatus Marinimicrobia bacterium]|nr:D-aminoacylase [Candidatus Neomarinimicrobiota bacterium]